MKRSRRQCLGSTTIARLPKMTESMMILTVGCFSHSFNGDSTRKLLTFCGPNLSLESKWEDKLSCLQQFIIETSQELIMI